MVIFLFFAPTVSAQVVINEVFPDPPGNDNVDEWVELFNTSNADVDVTGYKLIDAADHELIIDSTYTGGSTVIPSSGWLTVSRNSSVFSLNNDGSETIRLLDLGLSEIDSFTYTNSDTDRSWGRIPDGGSINSETLNPTKNGSNQSPPTPTNSPTPSPKPTSTPKSTATTKPSPTTKATPTIKPTVKAAKTTSKLTPTKSLLSPRDIDEKDVLGTRDDDRDKSGENKENDKRNFPFLALVFIVGGVVFVGIAGYPFIKKWKKSYNLKRGKKDKQKEI